MDRLLTMSTDEFVSRMQPEVQRILRQIGEAVNKAPQGNVISGSEMQVRDLAGELRQKAFELALQMRIDATEGAFSPSGGRRRQGQGKQGPRAVERAER